MKKFITFIVALLYFSTSTGAVIHMHYCMGKMTGWGLVGNSSGSCSKCGMEKSAKKDNGCCKDEIKLIKNDSDQKSNSPGFQFICLISLALPADVTNFASPLQSSITEENPVSQAPPRSQPVAVYILHRSFLI